MQQTQFLANGPIGLIAGAAYTLLLLIGAVGDFRSRRIPNRLVVMLAVLGLAYGVFVTPTLAGALRATGGLVTGLVCWLPFYALGWLGAGDVKLFAAAGAWLGPLHTLEGSLIAAVAGAVLALIWMLWSYGARDAATTLALAAARPSMLASGNTTIEKRKTLPYGIALSFGALVAAWAPGLLLS
ncbi:MAG: prepilin peptidase [Gemmatimonadales bacterium]